MSTPIDPRWPGETLGLPAEGPRSMARFGRRLGGVAIDWAVAWVISVGFFPDGAFQSAWWVTLTVFGVVQLLFLLFTSGTLGHLVLGMRVVPLAGGRMRFWQPLVRTALLCLAVPALISDANQRGLHDRAAQTVLVLIR